MCMNFYLKEKEIYRWPARESLKTMLAMGWNLERTKEGESIGQQRENEKLRSVSQSSQVRKTLFRNKVCLSFCLVLLQLHYCV